MTCRACLRRHERVIVGCQEGGVKSFDATSESFDKAAQFLTPTRMPQLAQGLGFDLSDTLSGHFEILSHLFQRVIRGFSYAEPFPQNLLFARGQRFQGTIDLSLQIIPNRRF